MSNRPPPDRTRRSESAHTAVLDAAISLVADLGYVHVTMDAIARRARVGKQTIYRWWSSRDAVLLEALEQHPLVVATVLDTGDLQADLGAYADQVARALADDAGEVYRGLVGRAQSDPELARAIRERILLPLTEAAARRLRRAQVRGEIRDDVTVAVVIDLLSGALHHALLVRMVALPRRDIDALLDAIVDGVRRSSG